MKHRLVCYPINAKMPLAYGETDMAEIIDAQPTIEAEPIKHGRWEEDGQCSVCKDYPLARYMRNPNYCPNCGAKMNGGTTK